MSNIALKESHLQLLLLHVRTLCRLVHEMTIAIPITEDETRTESFFQQYLVNGDEILAIGSRK